VTPPTVLKFYLTPAPFLTERFLSISSQPHACFFLPFPLSISSEQAAGSLSPSARSEQAGTSVRRAPGREQARPRAGGDERASGREQVRLRAPRRRGRACAGQAGELPPCAQPGTRRRGQASSRGAARRGRGPVSCRQDGCRCGLASHRRRQARPSAGAARGKAGDDMCSVIFFSFLIMLVMNLCVM